MGRERRGRERGRVFFSFCNEGVRVSGFLKEKENEVERESGERDELRRDGVRDGARETVHPKRLPFPLPFILTRLSFLPSPTPAIDLDDFLKPIGGETCGAPAKSAASREWTGCGCFFPSFFPSRVFFFFFRRKSQIFSPPSSSPPFPPHPPTPPTFSYLQHERKGSQGPRRQGPVRKGCQGARERERETLSKWQPPLALPPLTAPPPPPRALQSPALLPLFPSLQPTRARSAPARAPRATRRSPSRARPAPD